MFLDTQLKSELRGKIKEKRQKQCEEIEEKRKKLADQIALEEGEESFDEDYDDSESSEGKIVILLLLFICWEI